jgi:hypothetical protein
MKTYRARVEPPLVHVELKRAVRDCYTLKVAAGSMATSELVARLP